MPSYSLFSAGDNIDGGWKHGRAFAAGTLTATAAARRRMVELELGAEFEASLEGEARRGFFGSLEAGARAEAGVGLRVGFPLDLFGEAGVVARARAQASANAWIRAQIGLEIDVFETMLKTRIGAPWDDFVRIFIEESEISAGAWGYVAASAEAVAEAAVVGTLVRTDTQDPGFTASFRYAAGWGYGGGYGFLANFGLRDPERLMARLATLLADKTEQALYAAAGQVSPEAKAAIQNSGPVLRFLLPVAYRSAFGYGAALTQHAAARVQESRKAIADATLAEARQLICTILVESATASFHDLLHIGHAAVLAQLPLEERRKAFEALEAARAAVGLLATTDLRSGANDRLALIENGVAALWTLANIALPDEGISQGREAACIIWSAAALGRLLHQAATQGGRHERPTPLQPPQDIAIHIASTLNRPAGVPLSSDDLVAYLIRALASLPATDHTHAAAPAFELLRDIFVPGGTVAELAATILGGDLGDDDEGLMRLVGQLIGALGPHIEGPLVNEVLPMVARTADPAVRTLIAQVVMPALLSLTRVVFPGIGKLAAATDDDVRVQREQLSITLLQLFAEITISASEILAEIGARDGAKNMRQLARTVETLPNAIASTALVAQIQAMLGPQRLIVPLSSDIPDVLRLAADVMDYWNERERQTWCNLARGAVRFALAEEGTLTNVWTTLDTNRDDHPVPGTLPEFADTFIGSLRRLLNFVLPRILKLISDHFMRLSATAIEALEETATALVRAAVESAAWIAAEVERLKELVKQIAAKLAQAAAELAAQIGQIAQRARALLTSSISGLQQAAWSTASALLESNPIFQALPDVAKTLVRDALATTFKTAFDSALYLASAPLKLLESVGQWTHDALTKQFQTGSFSLPMLRETLRQQILNAGANALQFPLKLSVGLGKIKIGPIETDLGTVSIDLGTIKVPSSDVLASIANVVLNDQTLNALLSTSTNTARKTYSTEKQLSTIEQALNGTIAKDEADAAVATLLTRQPLEAQVLEPKAFSNQQRSAVLRILVRGANLSFIDATAGVPPRVRILVNGVEHTYAAGSWKQSSAGIEFTAVLVPSLVGLAPRSVTPPARLVPVELPSNLVLAAKSDAQRRVVIHAVEKRTVSETPTLRAPRSPVMPNRPPIQPLEGRTVRGVALVPRALDFGRAPIPAEVALPTGTAAPDGSVRAFAVQNTARFTASPIEVTHGFRWTPQSTILEPDRETILGRRGVNDIRVVVADGDGRRDASGCTFVLRA